MNINDFNSTLKIHIEKAIQDGIVLGMKECLKILNQYLDIKQKKGFPAYIEKGELELYMNTYILEQEKQLNENFKLEDKIIN
jgi:hypothetical protein